MASDTHSIRHRLDESTTYPQWLTAHDDATLAALITHSAHLLDLDIHHPDSYNHAPSADALLSLLRIHRAPLLADRTSAELAVLHALTELDAAHQATNLDELAATLEELFAIAGTPDEEWLTDDDLLATIHDLAADGLLYGDALRLVSPHAQGHGAQPDDDLHPAWIKLAPAIPELFDVTTEQLWRLADCNRCPIPAEHLDATVADMPARRRRLINTLHHAGGVGHSESLRPDADPEKPLPSMVLEGILDQLDDNTARLTGRVQQHLNGTVIGPIGGVFRPAPTEIADTFEAADAAATSAAVQTIHDLTDVLQALRSQPLQPLTAGGVGVRELTKLTRAISAGGAHGSTPLPIEELTRRLELAVHSGLVNLGNTERHEELWAITPTGLEFLAAPLATAWALLLRGWFSSDYAPWLTETPEFSDAKPLAESLFHPAAARLRALTPAALTHRGAQAQHDYDLEELLTDRLWRTAPYAAWSTPRSALSSVIEEARALGIVARVRSGRTLVDRPSGAAAALCDTRILRELEQHLDAVLPAPVDTLIVQADHTILAPGLLTVEDEDMLRIFSKQESSGVASVWRVTEHSLFTGSSVRSIDDFLSFLAERNPTGGLDGLPQSLRYLAADVQRSLAKHSDSAEAADSAEATSPETTTAPTTVTVADPQRTAKQPQVASIPQHIHDIIDAVREAAEDEDDEAKAAVTSPGEMLATIKQAHRADQSIDVTYAAADGTRHSDRLSIIMVSPSGISAVEAESGRTVQLQAHRLIAVKR